MISKDTIRNIIDAARVEDIISDFVTLKKRGANFLGLCPFHNEKTPSFTVSPSKGIYKCFGCGKAGDSVRFLMEHDQMTYPEALRFLANRYNIEIEESTDYTVDKEAESLKEGLYLINDYAARFFENNLWENEKGRAVALSYLMERGFDEKTIRYFNIGFNPEDYDAFSKSAVEKGYKKELLEKTGLTIIRDNRLIDRFRARVIFPIRNLSGRVIGFGGRTLQPDGKMAKYVNSPESEVYSKSHQLYGLFSAKKSIVKEDEVYLVEGYTDVVSLYQSGVENAVAPLGTSLTEDQIKLIRRYTKNVVLLFDGDAAGTKATLRATDMLLEEGLNVKIVAFPDGQDPDTYSKSHSDDALQKFLKNNQQDFITYRLAVHEDGWQSDPIKKTELMKEILNSVSKVSDHLLRSFYLKEFSQKTGVNEQSAIYELNRIRRKLLQSKYGSSVAPAEEKIPFRVQNEEVKDPTTGSRDKKEEKIIELLFKYGHDDLIFDRIISDLEKKEIKTLVSKYVISDLDKDGIVFRNRLYKKVFDYYREMLTEGKVPDQKDFLEHDDEEIRNVSYDLMSVRHILSENWENMHHIFTKKEEKNVKYSIDRAIYTLKLSEVMIRLSEFEERMKSAENEELTELLKFQKSLSEAKKAIALKLGMTIT